MTIERDAPPALLRVNNLGLIVADLDRSLVFYRDVLGLDVAFSTPWIENSEMLEVRGSAASSMRIAALQFPGMEATVNLIEEAQCRPESKRESLAGLVHISLRVDDLERWVRRCADAGFDAVARPRVINGPSTVKIAFLPDPDGYLVEFVEPLPR